MATISRWDRLRMAALRLREIQIEAEAIYRRFPELDHRPKIVRAEYRRSIDTPHTSATAWLAKLH